MNLSKLLKITTVSAIAWSLTSAIASAQLQRPSPPSPSPQQRLIRQIQTETETEIKSILSPDQQSQYQAARRRGTGMLDSLDDVENLTENQQRRVNEIVRKASRRVWNVVPPSPRQ